MVGFEPRWGAGFLAIPYSSAGDRLPATAGLEKGMYKMIERLVLLCALAVFGLVGVGCGAPTPGRLPVDNPILEFEAPDKDKVVGDNDDDDWDLDEGDDANPSGANPDGGGGDPCGGN